MVPNERSSVALRSTLVADLKVGDHIIVDEKHIGIVAETSRTFFKNIPYIDVSYLAPDGLEDIDLKTRRYFTDVPTRVPRLLFPGGRE